MRGPVVHRFDLKRMHDTHATPWTQHAVIEGLLELYRRSGSERWLDRAIRLADAQCARQAQEGHFRGAGHENDRLSSLVHNALADCALLGVARVLEDRSDGKRRERYLHVVEKNLVDYVVGKLYRPKLAGFAMDQVDYYAGTDRFIANMNSVALEALVGLDIQCGTTRFAPLVGQIAETLLRQQAHDGPCRGSFCYSHLEPSIHIPLYTALTLRGLPALLHYTGNTEVRDAAASAVAFLASATDAETGLWVHQIEPGRLRRYPIFVAGAGMICSGIDDASRLAGLPVDAAGLAGRLLRYQYPNGAIQNFIGYDHTDNGRRHGSGEPCWEDAYPTPNWNAQAFRFLARTLPVPDAESLPRLRAFARSSRRDGYVYWETSRFSLIRGKRGGRKFFALYFKPLALGLVTPGFIRTAAKTAIGAATSVALRARRRLSRLALIPRISRRRAEQPRTPSPIAGPARESKGTSSILLATSHAFAPQQIGGSQTSIHHLCLALRRRGVEASVYSAWSPVMPSGEGYIAEARRGGLVRDAPFGYPVFRSTDPVNDVPEAILAARPSAVIVNAGEPLALADRLMEHGVPTVVYVRDAEFDQFGGTVRQNPRLRYVTTSRALAAHFEKRFGIRPASIPPIVIPELYEVESSKRTVTFVCPIEGKGVDIAFALAERRKDIPFTFVESWPLRLRTQSRLKRRAEALGNVTLRASTQDMREIYRETRIVLAPSLWFEAWGRIVGEAQVSGIPALVSDAGGLPEAVGPGGLIVPRNSNIDAWERALAKMWDDAEAYQRLSELAHEHARRAEFRPDALLQDLLDVVAEIEA